MDAKVIESSALHYVLVTPPGFAADGSKPLVVLMHGYGANMYDLAGLAQAIDASSYVYAFPNAPYSMGGSGFSWLLGRPGVIEPQGPAPTLEERFEVFLTEVARETGVGDGNVVLGGFSQGGGLALSFGLTRPEQFTGLIVLSGFFRNADEVEPRLPRERRQPIFMAHGRQDPVVPLAQAHETKAFLERAGYPLEYHEYDMQHSVSQQVVDDLGPWLQRTLPSGR